MQSRYQRHERETPAPQSMIVGNVTVEGRIVLAILCVNIKVKGDHRRCEARRQSGDQDREHGKVTSLVGVVDQNVDLQNAAGNTFCAQLDPLENKRERKRKR